MLVKPVKVIDAHCHLASLKATPTSFLRGIAANMSVAAIASGQNISVDQFTRILVAQQNDDDGDILAESLRLGGVDSAILLAPDFSYTLTDALDYAENISHHISVCKRHGGFFKLFAGIDPRWGKAALVLLEQQIKSGQCHGIKLYPPCGFSLSDQICFPIYEIARDYRVPVLYHSGPTSPALSFKYSDPYDIDEAALQFKDVNFIAAHGAVNNWQQFILLAKYRSNIYLDISGFQAGNQASTWPTHLSRIFNCNINHKLIYGSDWPVFKNKGSFKETLEIFYNYDGKIYQKCNKTDSDNIMYKNIERLLAD